MMAHKMNQISITPDVRSRTLIPSDDGKHRSFTYAKYQSACP